MKKYIYTFIIFLLFQSVYWSNPVETPITEFSELVFHNNNTWIMEIQFPFGYTPRDFDSIFIQISNVKAKVNYTHFDTFVGIITPDMLSIPISINQQGDTIIIYSYSLGILFDDTMIFGDCTGATVGKPINGFSLCRINGKTGNTNWKIDCLTKNSSIGKINTTDGCSGTMQGHIYDVNDNLIVSLTPTYIIGYPYFKYHISIIFGANGIYKTKIFNTIHQPGCLYLLATDFSSWKVLFEIDSFDIKEVNPDTLIIQDIHLKNECNCCMVDECNCCQIVSDVEENISSTVEEFRLINYPNPFNSSTNFFIKIPATAKNDEANIFIYDVNGKLVKSIPVHESSTIKWDGNDANGVTMSSGIYYYNLEVGSKVVKSGSMILLK